MADLYKVTVTALAPKKGRTHPVVSLHVLQLRFEGGLRGTHPDRWARFAGRLLWDSELPVFRQGIADPWADNARFKLVTKSVVRDVVRHDLLRLIDHDRPGLERLIERTGHRELDPEVYASTHGARHWPHRDEPGHYSHFLEEGRVDVSLGIEIPPELTVGREWKSAAYF